jgi:hypothetical protein
MELHAKKAPLAGNKGKTPDLAHDQTRGRRFDSVYKPRRTLTATCSSHEPPEAY